MRAGLVLVTFALATSSSNPIVAQQAAAGDSVRIEIRETLRAFYFNLAHSDWEALTAHVLAAKVVAHREPPAALLAIGRSAPSCSGQTGPQIDRSAIALRGQWAEVFVPRCGLALAGGDEFRLIRFERRWRFVAIRLFDDPLNLSTAR